MADFLKFFDKVSEYFPMHLYISYGKIADWEIEIIKRGCAVDFPGAEHDGSDVVICRVQDSNQEICFARAYVELEKWLCEFNGGY